MQNDEKRKAQQRKAVSKYKDLNYKQLKIETKAQYIDNIKNYCTDMGVTYVDFIIRACNYFIERGELPPIGNK